MALKIDDRYQNYINQYVVNMLFGKSNKSGNDVVETLQKLSENYATISNFGKKLNDIYNTLSENNASGEALKGARDVILTLANSNNSPLKTAETINAIDNLKQKPELFENFFKAANTIKNNSYDLGLWLNDFNGVSKYGFADKFINETNSILSLDKNQNLFNNFINKLNEILSSVPSSKIITNQLNNFFKGLASYSSLEEKNAFISNFKAG